MLVLVLVLLLICWWLLHLKRKIKQHNHINWGSRFLNVIDGICRLYCYRFHGLSDSKLHLPEEGGAILISNHVSGVDPLLLVAASTRPLRFMIAKEEYERFGLQWLFKGAGCIPVDRTGRPDIAFRQAKRALERGEILALFPHGKIHLDHEQPYRVKPGIKKLSELTGYQVFVTRIVGVKGQGSVFKPIFLPSKTSIEQFPNIDKGYFSSPDSLVQLGELLLGHRKELD